MKRHWYHYLWLYSLFFFAMGYFHIMFAWLGLISFILPLVFAVGFGTKGFCNRYCDRGQLLRMLGSQLGWSRGHDMPEWMKHKWFRYGFMLFFLAMFADIIYMTWQVSQGSSAMQESITLFWSIALPWTGAYDGGTALWAAEFAFRLYSLMLTSALIGIASMLYYRPRSWCVYCPMGTLTQLICRSKSQGSCGQMPDKCSDNI